MSMCNWELISNSWLAKVAVGPKGVWGLSYFNQIYKRTETSRWRRIFGRLKEISVGKNSIWGISLFNNIYRSSKDGRWLRIKGSLSQVNMNVFFI